MECYFSSILKRQNFPLFPDYFVTYKDIIKPLELGVYKSHFFSYCVEWILFQMSFCFHVSFGFVFSFGGFFWTIFSVVLSKIGHYSIINDSWTFSQGVNCSGIHEEFSSLPLLFALFLSALWRDANILSVHKKPKCLWVLRPMLSKT